MTADMTNQETTCFLDVTGPVVLEHYEHGQARPSVLIIGRTDGRPNILLRLAPGGLPKLRHALQQLESGETAVTVDFGTGQPGTEGA